MKLLLLVTIVTVIILSIWRYRTRSRRRRKHVSLTTMPSDFTLNPTPLLGEDEVALYNLLRMVVQERYLVFAKVPLGSFLTVDAVGGKERVQVLRQLALKRVDFALVHPGSRLVEQVVQVESQSPELHQVESQQIIESLLETAGIKLRKLQAKKTYPLAHLATRLEIAAND
ncbi:MAG: DUF2726 domain-containing protein [Nitrospira sp.]|nr:DUF2726 domain-containing protein [Nitrospira sp.]MDH4302940.1 DUF2726 domain-containing protein [Nitrospira sp.]MDH5192579.1 DUF2726 domain-containing protein [Nitrospira sp.]